VSEASIVKPHDLAAAEISGWRGRCLDLFAKGERIIDTVLEAADGGGVPVSMKHLAGQRIADMQKLAAAEKGATEKQRHAGLACLEGWQAVHSKRAFFAHGVVTTLIDKQAGWHVQLDFTRYQGKLRDRQRWTISQQEALEFEERLVRELQALSAQLGQIRKRLAA
jgi:hypothetical protein